MKITVLDDYHDTVRSLACFRKLDGHDVTVWHDHTQDIDVLAERLADTEVLVLIRERTHIRAPLLARLPKLKLISQRSVYPHIDIDACTQQGVVVSSNQHAGTPSYATAELTWGLILSAFRQIPAADGLAQGRQLADRRRLHAPQQDARNFRLWPHRRRGRKLRPRLRHERRGLGAAAIRWFAPRPKAISWRRARWRSSSVVTCCHCTCGSSMRRAASSRREDLKWMKPTALIVNTSRAPLIEPGALVEALRAGRPGMAAVDVYEEEPMRDTTHPLLNMPNVICTPHLGYVTREEYELQFTDIFDQIMAYAAGNPINVVNRDVLKSAFQQILQPTGT